MSARTLFPSFLLRLSLVSIASLGLLASSRADDDPFWTRPLPEELPELFASTGTCNSYLLRDGQAALVIDPGDGRLLDHLEELGVTTIEWVVATDHHREGIQGLGRFDRSTTELAVPSGERRLFETPTEFRKWYPSLGDEFTVYGASYVRPPSRSFAVDRELLDGRTLTWRSYELECVSTPGHSPSGMTYVIRSGETTIAFCGGTIRDGARMSNWYDTEWDYGFAIGLDTLIESIGKLREIEPKVLLPRFGPPISDASEQLSIYRDKLVELRRSYVRGYPVFDATEAQRDPISTPTEVPQLSRVTPHLYKLREASKGANFAILIADSGHALVLDCGLFPEAMLDEMIVGMREKLGLKKIDAFWISHMHGDHFLLGPTLARKHGAEAWTLDRIVDRCEHPRRYDYAALISAYSDGFDGMKIDRSIADGETIRWEGYELHVDWMPGQTEFGCCLWLDLDGKRIAFTGDNLFGSPTDPEQDGHEAVVARNSAIFEEGYGHAAKYLTELKPDIVMGSHSFVMPEPTAFIERYRDWSDRIVELYSGLMPHDDYEYGFDPYWVSAYPYRVDLASVDESKVTITVRNFRDAEQMHRVALKLPDGITADPPVLEGSVAPHSRRSFDVTLQVDRSRAPQGLSIVPMDIVLNEEAFGERFDFLLRTSEANR